MELALDGVDEDEEYKSVQRDYVLVEDTRSEADKATEGTPSVVVSLFRLSSPNFFSFS